MATYRIKLKRREEVAEGTSAVYFEKPEGFQFNAGQFLRFTTIDPPETDAEGNSRSFSIASAPHEEDLMIATRMRDTAFKRILKTMPPGSEIEIKGPYGKMALHEDASRTALFLTGGIGITPFRSIALDAAHSALLHPIYLFYSNRRPEDAAFLDELTELEKFNANYRFIPTMTSTAASNPTWTGETGYINREMLSRFIENLTSAVYYIAGPQGLVSAMKKMLGEAGVSEADIRAEEFTGYRSQGGDMAQVSFDKDIKLLMTELDREHMEFMLDLWSYKDVKENADVIYDSVSNGRMPPPSGGGPWSKDKVDLFKQWIDDGHQP